MFVSRGACCLCFVMDELFSVGCGGGELVILLDPFSGVASHFLP